MKPYPVIIVPGIGQSRTRLVENGKLAWPLDIDKEALKKIVLAPAIRMVILRHDCGFEKALRKALYTALEPLRSTEEGYLVHPVRVETFEESIADCNPDQRHFISRMVPYSAFADSVGEDNLYYFAYNPMGDTTETVENLRKFVLHVREKTGAEKVSFIPISLGGTIITQYLDQYVSCGDTARVVGIVAAFDGSRLLSGLFQKNIPLEGITGLMEMLVSRKDAEALNKVKKYLPDKLLRRYVAAALDVLVDILHHCPIMWGTIPASLYPEIRDSMLADSKYAELRRRTDYAYSIRADFPKLVKKCADEGVDIYSLHGCGLHLLAVDDDADSDGVVHAASCRMGETLSDSPIAEHVRAFPGMDHEGAAEEATLLALCSALLREDVDDIQNFNEKVTIQ